MADESKTILLKVELDVKQAKINADKAVEDIARIKARQEELKATTGTNTVEYAKLREELKQANKALNDNAAALAINDKLQGKTNLTTIEQAQAQKALAVAYNNLTQDERENTEAGKKLTKQYAEMNAALQKQGLAVNDGRRSVGLYEQAIRAVIGEIDDLKKTQNTIGYAMDQNKKKLDDNTQALKDLGDQGITPLDAEYKAIAKEVEFYTDALVENEKTLQQVNAELVTQEAVLETTTKEAAKIGFVYGNNANAAESLRKQIKDLKTELSTLDPGSDKFQEATAKAAELQDKLNDVNQAIKAQATGSGYEKLSNTFGQLKEDLLNLDFEGVAEKAKSLETISKGLTFKETIAGAKQMINAFISLGRALLANPLFLLVAVIGGIVAAIVVLSGSTRDLTAENEALNAEYERQVFFLDLLAKKNREKAEFDIELAKLQGKTAKEIKDLRLQAIDDEQAENEKRILNIMEAQKKKRKLEQDAIAEGNTELVESIRSETKELQNEFLTRINDRDKFYQQAILVDEAFYQEEKKKLEDAAKDLLEKRKEANRKFQDEARDAAEKIRNLTLENQKLSADNERAALEAEIEFRRNVTELEIQDAVKRAQALLEIEEERVARLAEIDADEKAARIARLESDAKKEIESVKGTAEQRAEQVRLINEQLNQEEEALDTEYDQREVQRAKELADKRKELATLTQEDINRLNAERIQKMEANLLHEETLLRGQGLKEEEIAKRTAAKRIEIAKAINAAVQNDSKASDADKLQAAAELEAKLLEIKKEGVDSEKKLTEKQKEDRRQIADASISAAQQLAATLFQIKQRQIEAELEAVQKSFDNQQEALQKQLDLGIISQENFSDQTKKLQQKQAQEEAKLKKEQFKKQKTADLVQAGINVGLAVTQALAGSPPPLSFILAGITAGLGAVQIAAIASAEEPAFADGGVVVSGKRIMSSDGVPIKRNNGDNLRVTAKVGEVILNERQQAALGGDATFASIGVPGFASGGIVANQLTAPIDTQAQQSIRIMDAISAMPSPVVYVEDIRSGTDRSVSVEESANIFG